MASARQTIDHDEIREWVQSRDGHPAHAQGTEVLRIDFEPENERLEPMEWDRFFEVFEENNLAFLYDPEGHMVKFIERETSNAQGEQQSPRRGRTRSAASAGRKKSTSGARKKSAATRKKSTAKRGSTSRKKSLAKKSSAKKSTAKKSGAKKSTAKKSSAKKSTAKKSAAKKSGGRKYGKKAQQKISRTMREYGSGKLKSGRSGRPVKNRKQAIAIGISEARSEGDKVPRRKTSSGGRKRKKS